MNRTSGNPSAIVELDFQINRSWSKTFNFYQIINDVTSDLDVSTSSWQFFVNRYPGDRKTNISLTLGSGITVSTNTMDVTATPAQCDIEQGEYYYELYNVTEERTYCSGPCNFNFEGVAADPNSGVIALTLDNDVIAISLVGGGGGGGGGSTTLDGLSVLGNNTLVSADGTSVTSTAPSQILYSSDDGTTISWASKSDVFKGLITTATDSDYTLSSVDLWGTIIMDSSSAHNLTINTSAGFSVGDKVLIRRIGTGQVTVVASGTTVTGTLGTLVDPGRYVDFIIECTATNTFLVQNGQPVSLVQGDITALGFLPSTGTEWTRVTINSNVPFTTNTGYNDITGLSFPVSANRRTEFRFVLYVTTSNASEGFRSAMNGTNLTDILYIIRQFTSATAETTRFITTFDDANGSQTASATATMAWMNGRVKCSSAGTVIGRMKTETGAQTVTVLSGSYVEYRFQGNDD